MTRKTKKGIGGNQSKRQGKPSSSRLRSAHQTGNQAPPRPPHLVILYGRNSVRAALGNPAREILEAHGNHSQFAKLLPDSVERRLNITPSETSDIIEWLDNQQVPHQAVALVCKRLADLSLEDVVTVEDSTAPMSLLVLDQVVDPQNVGAAIRVAAALGVSALVTQDRNVPDETGALARASAGTLDQLPWVKVGNLSRALDHLKENGFWVAGLDGTANTSIDQAGLGNRFALVMGSEGKGMRPGVAKSCDMLLKIPINKAIESLNVSVAAGIALYALSQKSRT